MGNAVRAILSVILATFGGLLGWSAAQATSDFYGGLTPPARLLNSFALICLGILLGLAVAPVVSRWLLRVIGVVSIRLEQLSLQQIVLGAVGLVFGLVVAFFTSLLITSLSLQRIPYLGPLLAPLLVIVFTVFWAGLGGFFGVRVGVTYAMSTLMPPRNSLISLAQPGLPKLLDTSVIIDGRIIDIARAGFLEGALLVPRFVLEELQQVADASDSRKRARGRRGLGLLETLQRDYNAQILDKDVPDVSGVDSKLVRLAQEGGLTLVTTDFNLNRVAGLQGVKVLNINELANAVKPVALAGETMAVQLVKEGKESGQGVGYLDDGTMVVVEEGRRHLGSQVTVEVTSVLQTHAGKMVFARLRPVAGGSSS